jgi:hypothetical protein
MRRAGVGVGSTGAIVCFAQSPGYHSAGSICKNSDPYRKCVIRAEDTSVMIRTEGISARVMNRKDGTSLFVIRVMPQLVTPTEGSLTN